MPKALALGLWGWAMRLATPILLLRWWRRGRVEPGYRQALSERLAWYSGPAPGAGWLWLHAVSLGETRAAAPLIAALREREPGLRLLLTHTTATGRAAGAELLRAGDAQAWLPLDTPGATRRFFAHWQPRQGVLMETEAWPQLLAAAQAAGVPVDLANARLSERSLRKGERAPALLGVAAARLRAVLAQTEADAQRLRRMGCPQVEVVGNLKYDLAPNPALLALAGQWRALLGEQGLVLAASTREGEEALLLAAWQQLPAPRPRLLIVPRHPQRFDEVAALMPGVARRSRWGPSGPDAQALSSPLWLGDSMREMALYYALADVALLGGSFEALGGQNLIEAAACGCPLLMGPSTFNFAEAAELSLAAGAARRVADAQEALRLAQQLLNEKAALGQMARAAAEFAGAHRGAAARMAERLIPRCDRPA
ncbi:3-deoxy-D-manno-octulosonic-acid transferase [Inhella inkyongensis]|uniref:3-deoxy-D-manno-octulosonic acid transferase n=1 Tax=Inhella inkyongensis TaxID=392593 RepID=A0A840S3P6_9BURK|nr:3-deoxy-D-manno-octulosonic acid transferase [Inhella inkyongensis]MBB5204172.1 3-deoxy-D-manno-octulosonic-acid transferase [Inhella inkyongensis]